MVHGCRRGWLTSLRRTTILPSRTRMYSWREPSCMRNISACLKCERARRSCILEPCGGHRTAILAELPGSGGKVLGYEVPPALPGRATTNPPHYTQVEVEHGSGSRADLPFGHRIYVNAGRHISTRLGFRHASRAASSFAAAADRRLRRDAARLPRRERRCVVRTLRSRRWLHALPGIAERSSGPAARGSVHEGLSGAAPRPTRAVGKDPGSGGRLETDVWLADLEDLNRVTDGDGAGALRHQVLAEHHAAGRVLAVAGERA